MCVLVHVRMYVGLYVGLFPSGCTREHTNTRRRPGNCSFLRTCAQAHTRQHTNGLRESYAHHMCIIRVLVDKCRARVLTHNQWLNRYRPHTRTHADARPHTYARLPSCPRTHGARTSWLSHSSVHMHTIRTLSCVQACTLMYTHAYTYR